MKALCVGVYVYVVWVCMCGACLYSMCGCSRLVCACVCMCVSFIEYRLNLTAPLKSRPKFGPTSAPDEDKLHLDTSRTVRFPSVLVKKVTMFPKVFAFARST